MSGLIFFICFCYCLAYDVYHVYNNNNENIISHNKKFVVLDSVNFSVGSIFVLFVNFLQNSLIISQKGMLSLI